MRMLLRGLLFGVLIAPGDLLAQASATPGQVPSGQDANAPPKPGVIRGRVIATDTGAGLSKATLVFMSIESQGRGKPLRAKTGPTGEYELKDVKPGRYTLRASRNGYVSQAYGQKPSDSRMSPGTLLVIRTGEILDQVDFKLTPGGIIEGHVVDSDGEPMAYVQVTLESFVFVEGKRTLRPIGADGTTDDRGQFRIFGIAPGKYCVSARFQDWRAEDREDSTFPSVYYPGTRNAQEAARIDVVPGGQVSGIDIALSEAKAFSISGKVYRSDGKPAAEATLMNTRIEDRDIGSWTSRGGGVDPDGAFQLGGLMPGRYQLTAESRRSEKPQVASTVVEVGSEDVRGVVLSLGDGAELTGRVIVEGGNTKLLSSRMRVVLQSEAGRMMSFRIQGGEVLEDQTFALRDITEGAYKFLIFPLQPSLYLKSARVQGKDALDQAFEIKNGEKVTGAEIVLSTDGGEISGVIKDEATGEIVKGAAVLLFSTEAHRQGPRSRWTRAIQSDQQGGFRLSALIPGEYLICAVQNHEFGAEASREYLQELSKRAKSISVGPRSQLNESLLVQPAPALE